MCESARKQRQVSVREGERIELACRAESGYPVQPLVWKMNGHPIQGYTPVESGDSRPGSAVGGEGDTLLSVLNFTVQQRDHRAFISCEAINSISPEPKNDSLSLSVICMLYVLISINNYIIII